MKRSKFPKILSLVFALAVLLWGVAAVQARPLTGPGDIPDYFETPNWAYSPPLTKFLDDLAPLGCSELPGGKNNLGQCIPIAVPERTNAIDPESGPYPGSDYYEIELVEYREQMHSEFDVVAAGTLGDKIVAGSGGTATSGGTLLRGYRQTNTTDANLLTPHYLGPIIIAQKDRPVRVKFTNKLPIGAGGNLFVPVDTSIMGAGDYEIDYDPATGATTTEVTTGMFTQNRGELHLHGGRTPWISDGTPHQWITPTGETTDYPRGVSAKNVPDMPDPGAGSVTYYWTNQQSARLMFYHDHAWGITRLNVYVGEAAGYLIEDPVEKAMVNGNPGAPINGRTYAAGTIPAAQIPLVIQDKTFVDPTTIAGLDGADPLWGTGSDPTWRWGSNPVAAGNPANPVLADLWWPHVYMPAQNPFNPDGSGINPFGRWHYGPWFFPATPVCGSVPGAVPPFCINYGPIDNPYADPTNPQYSASQPLQMPGIDSLETDPHVSWGAEAFLDTMMVNGTVFPKLDVAAQQYRFRILNASHDRFLNLQLYRATTIVNPSTFTLDNAGAGYTSDPIVTIAGGLGRGATATATVDLDPASPTYQQIIDLTLDTVGSGYTDPLNVTIQSADGNGAGAAASGSVWTQLTEVGMVPAAQTPGFPANWPKDGREGGVPDPATSGPAFIQIGTEGGFLPKPAVLPNHPVTWNLDPTVFNVGNVLDQAQGGGTLILGPAERADVIVDFSNFDGQTLILYNDAPTAFPALDPHYDFYTGAPPRGDMGGYPLGVPPGKGPNIRTVMQINVGAGGSAGGPVNDYNQATYNNLAAAFAHDGTNPGAFASGQEEIVVGQGALVGNGAYNSAYNKTYPATWPYWGFSRISDGAISFQRVDGTPVDNFAMKPKAIHDEMGATFDDYGRMSAKLGLEMPFTNAAIANFILQNYVDPATEIVNPDEVQIWRITHNGVDTHPVHFHLFDVQVLNRVAWDGFIRPPDPNELGWKDTVRMAPLEDTIVALRPVAPMSPFGVPKSVRPLNPRYPLGETKGFSQIDITDGGDLVPLQTNVMTDFDNEYVWHCHILSHEENDMMRPIVFNAERVAPSAPTGLAGVKAGDTVNLTWTDPTAVADPATIGNPANEIGFRIERATGAGAFATIATALANATGYADTTATGASYRYQVVAFNAAGSAASAPINIGELPADTVTIVSATYDAGRRRLTVLARSDAQPGVTMTASATNNGNPISLNGGGNLWWNNNYNGYRRVFNSVNVKPTSVTVTSSGGGTATFNLDPADTVTIVSATYDAGRRRLIVLATSSAQPGVTMTASATINNNPINLNGGGSLPWNNNYNGYRRVFTNVRNKPTSVTVTSSGGGSANAAVN